MPRRNGPSLLPTFPHPALHKISVARRTTHGDQRTHIGQTTTGTLVLSSRSGPQPPKVVAKLSSESAPFLWVLELVPPCFPRSYRVTEPRVDIQRCVL